MLFESIHTYSIAQQLYSPSQTIVIGLSGGPDSLFLLHYLAYEQKAGRIKKVIAAHLDHQWRENSASDVLFCKHACEQLDIEFVSSALAELDFSCKKGSKEEIGRLARRHFLEFVLKEKKADVIALAHHLEDQEETFLIRLIRGSSLTGLIGMRPKAGIYIRPLLETSKAAILDYLNAHAISYLTDPTNVHFEHLRNRIRATVLPALKSVDSRFDQNFLVTINRLRETEDFLEALTASTFESISTFEDNHYILDSAALLQAPLVMQYRTLMYWMIKENVPFTPSQAFLNEIIRFLKTTESKQHTIHENWKLVKKKNTVWIQMQ